MFWIDIVPEHFFFSTLEYEKRITFFHTRDLFLKSLNLSLKKNKIKMKGLQKVVISLEVEESKDGMVMMPNKMFGTIGTSVIYLNFNLFFGLSDKERIDIFRFVTLKGMSLLGEKMQIDYKGINDIINEV